MLQNFFVPSALAQAGLAARVQNQVKKTAAYYTVKNRGEKNVFDSVACCWPAPACCLVVFQHFNFDQY